VTESFSNINEILKGVQFRNTNPAYGQLISEWNELVGKKFANKCEISEIKQNGTKLFLYVNVFSSPLVQELSFFKNNLLKKINEKYRLSVSDMIIKVSNKSSLEKITSKQNLVYESFDERPSQKELFKIELEKEEIQEIKNSIFKQTVFTNEEKERMLEIVINDLKTQKWMKEKGFPICKKCGCVMTSKNFGDENICKFCKNEQDHK